MSKMLSYRWITLLAAATLLLSGCGAPRTTTLQAATVDTAQPTALALNLDVATVQRLHAAGEIVIIDVREDYEYKDGHIPGAQLIPLGELPDRTGEIPRDETVVIVCRSGNRSAQAHRYLLNQGFTNVHNMTGGMLDWVAAGYETEK